MLERLVAFSLSQRLIVFLGVLVLVGVGGIVLPSLPIDAFPDVSPIQVKVIMKAPGLTPEEVEQRITVPIELELLGIPNKKILRSTTKYALADITIDFEDGTDIYWARNQVAERLASISRDLPDGVTGGLAPITSPLGEMFMFTINSPNLSLAERRSLLDWVIRPALRTIPGVADVNALGGYVRAFEIVPDPAALAARGIGRDAFRRAIEENSRNDGAGRISQGEDSALVRIEGALVFANIPFALIGGVFALMITREYLSVPASVGFIALLGIAVLNGVVLVSYFNQLRARGVSEARIVVEGAMRRLRPVLMTATITAFGLVPLLFATGPGSEIQQPLAIVVIGGLVSSTTLTLILLPVLYRRFGAPRGKATP